ncbi:MAG TPA: metallophosphoesterase family protein [Thermomicrobiales bacterium]|nr:metallophosphoesterase family protein [Thermomicrobiales bacterium]
MENSTERGGLNTDLPHAVAGLEPLSLGTKIGIFSDVHGATRTLERALERCDESGVETIALLGDLFDRHEQADGCAAALAGWSVVGVYGNHEREVALLAAAGELELLEETVRFLSGLQEDVLIDDVHLTHESSHWGHQDPVARMFGRGSHFNGHTPKARMTFAGHTHFRVARDERGTLDIARGSLAIEPTRRYLINPGALMIGQYAIWDRDEHVIFFRNVEY